MDTTFGHAGENEKQTRPTPGTSEAAIFSRMLESEGTALPVAAARAFLRFDFTQDDMDRMRQLSAKAREGTLSAEEQDEINNYERVGHILSLMKLKAERSLGDRRESHGRRT